MTSGPDKEASPTTDNHWTPEKPERPIARVTVATDAELLPAVVDFVRRVAQRLGLRDKAAEQLDRAVETVCRNVIEHAFDPDQAGQYDVESPNRRGRTTQPRPFTEGPHEPAQPRS